MVIESDDWGSERIPSKEALKRLVSDSISLFNNPFNYLDSLETENDLSALFEILTGYKDRNGNHPVITANTITANPDFGKYQHPDLKIIITKARSRLTGINMVVKIHIHSSETVLPKAFTIHSFMVVNILMSINGLLPFSLVMKSLQGRLKHAGKILWLLLILVQIGNLMNTGLLSKRGPHYSGIPLDIILNLLLPHAIYGIRHSKLH
jgi:hypothetical protein